MNKVVCFLLNSEEFISIVYKQNRLSYITIIYNKFLKPLMFILAMCFIVIAKHTVLATLLTFEVLNNVLLGISSAFYNGSLNYIYVV